LCRRSEPHERRVEVCSEVAFVVMDLKRLEQVELTGADGECHRLGDYWVDRAVILVFLRHFG
jgi:hypothetical protein